MGFPLLIIYALICIIYEAVTGKSISDLQGNNTPYRSPFENDEKGEMYDTFRKALHDNEFEWRTFDDNFNKKDD